MKELVQGISSTLGLHKDQGPRSLAKSLNEEETQKLGGAIVGLVVGKTLCSRTFRDSVSQVWNVLLDLHAQRMKLPDHLQKNFSIYPIRGSNIYET